MVWANLGWSFGFGGCKLTSFCLFFSPAPSSLHQRGLDLQLLCDPPLQPFFSHKVQMVHVYGDAGDPVDHLLSYQAYWQDAWFSIFRGLWI